MSILRYSMGESETNPMAEQLLYISSSVYEDDWKSMLHAHSFVELFFIMEGKGTLWLEDGKRPIQTGDMVVVNPNVSHTETSLPGKNLSYVVLGIDNLKFELMGEEGVYICPYGAVKSQICKILELMLDEIRRKEELHKEILQHYLAALLLKIRRLTHCDICFHDALNIPTECEKVKAYMDAHYQDTISLDTLAKLAHWDKFYLSHLFAKTFGIAPISYLLERRILHSKELLTSTNLGISQIAQSTGFSSQNYFSQMFKKSTGETPVQYRKRCVQQRRESASGSGLLPLL